MNKIHIGILGAGKIGTAIYNLLLISDFDYDITVADKNILNNINTCDFQRLAIGEDECMLDDEFDKFVKNKTLIPPTHTIGSRLSVSLKLKVYVCRHISSPRGSKPCKMRFGICVFFWDIEHTECLPGFHCHGATTSD